MRAAIVGCGSIAWVHVFMEKPPAMIEIECEKARIRIEELDVTIYTEEQVERFSFPWEGQLGKSYWGVSHTDCIQSFYESIEKGTVYEVELSDVEDTIWLMLHAYASAKSRGGE